MGREIEENKTMTSFKYYMERPSGALPCYTEGIVYLNLMRGRNPGCLPRRWGKYRVVVRGPASATDTLPQRWVCSRINIAPG